MSSIKCPECGFFSYAGLNACKRCNTPFTDAQPPAPKPARSKQQTETVARKSRASRTARRTPTFQPSSASIFKNDYVLLMTAFAVAGLWILFAAFNLLGMLFGSAEAEVPIKGVPAPAPDQTLLYLVIAGTIAGAVFAAWRVYFFHQIFAVGEETIGRVTNISFLNEAEETGKSKRFAKKIPFFKDTGRIEYVYTVNGRDYQSGNAVRKNQTTESLQNDDEIELVVDRSNPYRAFIKTLYS